MPDPVQDVLLTEKWRSCWWGRGSARTSGRPDEAGPAAKDGGDGRHPACSGLERCPGPWPLCDRYKSCKKITRHAYKGSLFMSFLGVVGPPSLGPPLVPVVASMPALPIRRRCDEAWQSCGSLHGVAGSCNAARTLPAEPP